MSPPYRCRRSKVEVLTRRYPCLQPMGPTGCFWLGCRVCSGSLVAGLINKRLHLDFCFFVLINIQILQLRGMFLVIVAQPFVETMKIMNCRAALLVLFAFDIYCIFSDVCHIAHTHFDGAMGEFCQSIGSMQG